MNLIWVTEAQYENGADFAPEYLYSMIDRAKEI